MRDNGQVMKGKRKPSGQAAWEALRRLVRERLARKSGGHLIEAQLDSLELRLPLPLDGGEDGPRRFSERLTATIDELLDDAVQQAAAFRPGHAYCHRCESVVCGHSTPPSCRHVFTGYAPTGLPSWEDFAQYCLELRHPEVDRLYDEPPALVTLVQRGELLHGGMLRAFHNPSYELMGQLAAGFFTVPARVEEGRGVLALTVQIAASHSRRGRPRLGVNVLGRTPSGEGLEALWDRAGDLPWGRAVRWAQSALGSLPPGKPGRGRRTAPDRQLERRVDGILTGLAKRLVRKQRARSRRTRHAEERHRSGERPTRKALDDARAAGNGALLLDERSGTLVVLGERGRTHFFTAEGQLVSSVRYSREAIERKLKLELWRKAPTELTEPFLEKIKKGDIPVLPQKR